MSEVQSTKFKPEYENGELQQAVIKIETELKGSSCRHTIKVRPTDREGEVRLSNHSIPNRYNDAGYNCTESYNLNDHRFQDLVTVREKLEELLQDYDLEWRKEVEE